MANKIPDCFLKAYKTLKLDTEELQMQFLEMLFKYSIPGIERARARRGFKRKQEILNVPIAEFFGERYAFYGTLKVLSVTQELMNANMNLWHEDTDPVYSDLVNDMKIFYEAAHNNYHEVWAGIRRLYEIDDSGRSTVNCDEVAQAQDEYANFNKRFVNELLPGDGAEALIRKAKILKGIKRVHVDAEAAVGVDENEARIAKLEKTLSDLMDKLTK